MLVRISDCESMFRLHSVVEEGVAYNKTSGMPFYVNEIFDGRFEEM